MLHMYQKLSDIIDVKLPLKLRIKPRHIRQAHFGVVNFPNNCWKANRTGYSAVKLHAQYKLPPARQNDGNYRGLAAPNSRALGAHKLHISILPSGNILQECLAALILMDCRLLSCNGA